MPLPALPPDPVPSEAELQAIIERRRIPVRPDATGRADITLALARITWKMERQAEDPNAFLVPFSTDPQAFGSKAAYDAYRKEPEWKAQRQRVFDRAGGMCVGCGAKATQVHHRDYRPRVIAGEDDVPLVALCRSCHQHLHERDAQGIEPSWQESEARLSALVALHETAGAT
jgi:hypothetical protein